LLSITAGAIKCNEHAFVKNPHPHRIETIEFQVFKGLKNSKGIKYLAVASF